VLSDVLRDLEAVGRMSVLSTETPNHVRVETCIVTFTRMWWMGSGSAR
jgi:hypothetical protein